jgi:hypothetical protein
MFDDKLKVFVSSNPSNVEVEYLSMIEQATNEQITHEQEVRHLKKQIVTHEKDIMMKKLFLKLEEHQVLAWSEHLKELRTNYFLLNDS